jgi:capsule polysaccharide export protein KpsE/RkpR
MRDPVANSDELVLEGLEGSSNHANPAEERAARERAVGKMRRLWDQRQAIFRVMGAALILSTLVAFLIPKRFESTTRLMPPTAGGEMALLAAISGGRSGAGAGSSAPSLGSGLGSIAGDLLGMKSSGALFIGILQGTTVEDDLINKFDLRKLYGDRYWEDARKDLEKKSDVSEDRKSGIITIRVTDRNPQQAAAMAQEYVDELKRLLTQVDTSSAHRERVFLEGRLAQVKDDLEGAEKSFSEFASKNMALDIQAQGKAMIEAGATLEGQLIGAETELQSLKQIYSDGNVRVRTMQARVNELQHQVEKLGGKFDSATGRNAEPNQSIYPSIRKLPILGVSYADLYRNTKLQEAIFETLTQGYELAKVQEAKESPSVKVIDPPNFPQKKSFPPRLIIITLCTVLCGFFAGVWILGNAYWMEIDEQDPGKVLALEVFKSVASRFPSNTKNGASTNAAEVAAWEDSSKRNGSTPDKQNKEAGRLDE